VVLGASRAVGCRDATELRVVVQTDVDCTIASAHGAVLRVGAVDHTETSAPAAETRACDASGLGSLVLVPSSGNAGSKVDVVVALGVDRAGSDCDLQNPQGCIVARRRIGFVRHTGLALPIRLGRACLGVACAAGSTCVDGTCRSAEVDTSKCAGDTCNESALGGPGGELDAGTGDAGNVDAAADANTTTCSGTTCAGSCVDLTTSGANCGACGFDCGAGRCVGGVCRVLADGVAPAPGAGCVAIGATSLFVAGGGSAGKITEYAKNGTAILNQLPSVDSHVILVHPTRGLVYASNGQLLLATSLGAAPTTLVASAGIVSDAALAGDQLAFATTTAAGVGTVLGRCDLPACTALGTAQLAAQDSPTQLAFDPAAGAVFAAVPNAGAVLSAVVSGGVGIGPKFTGLGPQGVALDGKGNLFFSEGSDTVISAAPVSGGAKATLVTLPQPPRRLAYDAARKTLYASSVDGGTTIFQKITLGLGPPAVTIYVTSASADLCITQDDAAIYWFDANLGPMRAAK
jgi:hypothetical protein